MSDLKFVPTPHPLYPWVEASIPTLQVRCRRCGGLHGYSQLWTMLSNIDSFQFVHRHCSRPPDETAVDLAAQLREQEKAP